MHLPPQRSGMAPRPKFSGRANRCGGTKKIPQVRLFSRSTDSNGKRMTVSNSHEALNASSLEPLRLLLSKMWPHYGLDPDVPPEGQPTYKTQSCLLTLRRAIESPLCGHNPSLEQIKLPNSMLGGLKVKQRMGKKLREAIKTSKRLMLKSTKLIKESRAIIRAAQTEQQCKAFTRPQAVPSALNPNGDQ